MRIQCRAPRPPGKWFQDEQAYIKGHAPVTVTQSIAREQSEKVNVEKAKTIKVHNSQGERSAERPTTVTGMAARRKRGGKERASRVKPPWRGRPPTV